MPLRGAAGAREGVMNARNWPHPCAATGGALCVSYVLLRNLPRGVVAKDGSVRITHDARERQVVGRLETSHCGLYGRIVPVAIRQAQQGS